MGLNATFRKMLQAPFVLERNTGKDGFGNETYSAPSTEKAFIDTGTMQFGRGEEGRKKEIDPATQRSLLTDYLGIKVRDRVTFDSITWTVVEVESFKDQKGGDLFQQFTVENQKKG